MERAEISKQHGYNFLWIGEDGKRPELWMWDLPEEVEEQKLIANEAYGEVLVAGYGLGVVQKLLLENPDVTRVVTCEVNPSVIEVNKQTFGKLYGDVIICDFYQFNSRKKFDCVIGDIWINVTPEDLSDYVSFKKKAKSMLKSGGRILAWGQDYFEYKLKHKS